MDVTGLMRFMDNSKYYDVQRTSLRELANEHRQLINERPVLVIDGSIITEIIDPVPDHWIFGGQFRHYVQNIKHLVRMLNELDIEAEYYFDHYSAKRMTTYLASHRRNGQKMLETAFADIKEGYLPEVTLKFSPCTEFFACYALKYECGAKVFNTLENKYRQISKVARDNTRCFGILAKSSEFVIFDTKPLIYSRPLNISTMEVKVYRRDELVKATRLKSHQLPLLSCMLGNNIVLSEFLRDFHFTLSRKYGSDYKYLADEVAKIIRYQYQWWNGRPNDISEAARSIGVTPRKLKEGIYWYNNEHPPEETNASSCSSEASQLLHDKCSDILIPPQLYVMLNYYKYDEPLSLEDPTDNSMPPSALIYRSLRRRMYTVLSGGETIRMREWCAYRGRNLNVPEIIKNLQFEFTGKIPTVVDLFSDKATEDMRWDVLFALLAVTISSSELKKIEVHFVTLCCLLNHLMHFRGLELPVWEVKAFISQAVHPRANDLDYLASLEVTNVQPRAVTLAGIFVRGITNMMNLVGASGLPLPLTEVMPWKYFDGKLFHHCYNYLSENINTAEVILNLLDNDTQAFNKFKHLYRVTIEGVARAEHEERIVRGALGVEREHSSDTSREAVITKEVPKALKVEEVVENVSD